MNRLLRFSLLPLLVAATASAEVPVKKPMQVYSMLWNRSPFTTAATQPSGVSPEPAADDPSSSIASQWSLCGVSRFSDGSLQVTLMNRKEPTRKLILRPDGQSPFNVIKVERGNGSLDELAVTLSDGSRTETLPFDKDLLTPARKPSASKAATTPPKAILLPES